jgi:tetratricopeptide (TPR) repeat protein
MDESFDAILGKFSKLALEERFVEAEKLIAGKITEGNMNRNRLVSAVITAAIRIGDCERLDGLRRYPIALNYLKICMKLNRQKKVELKIKILLAEVNFNLGLIFDKAGKLEDEEAAYREASRYNPKLSSAYNNLGILLCETGRLKESEAAYLAALDFNPKDPAFYFNLAISLEKLRRLDEAEQAYREALKINPQYAIAYSNLGLIFLESSRLAEAEACFRKALKINDRLAELPFNLGITLHKLGRSKESEVAYLDALRINPNDAEAYNNLGNVLQDQGRLDEAETAYKKALRINPGDALVYRNLGNALSRLGKADEAEAAYMKALKIIPQDEDTHFNLGVLYHKVGKLAESEAAYNQTLKSNPRDAAAYSNLGNTLREMGKLREAEVACREASIINPQLAEPHNVLGLVLNSLRRFDEAEEEYRKALRLNPRLAEAHFNLGILLFETSRLDEAAVSFGISAEMLAEKGRKGDLALARGYGSWIDGFRLWQKGNLEEGERRYAAASRLFVKAKERDLASILTLIVKLLRIDRDYLNCIRSGSLAELRKGVLFLSRRIVASIRTIRKAASAEMEILNAKAVCVQILKNILFFEPIEPRQLEEAKKIFYRHHFLHAYEGANAIDTFRLYLNTFCPSGHLDEIQKDQEEELFRKLNPATSLDGMVTQRFAKLVADSLKSELYSAVAEPIIKEQRQTRKVISQKIGRIQRKLETIHVTLQGIEHEIGIRRVAYGEFEIIFPAPYGVYKLHIPAGNITTEDIINIKTEIHRVFSQILEKAKHKSLELYCELKSKERWFVQQVLTKLKTLRHAEGKEANSVQ